ILKRKFSRKRLPIALKIGDGRFDGNLKLPKTSPTVKIIENVNISNILLLSRFTISRSILLSK
ncbi:MAG TPA: hypothetical protein PKK55_03740, partial [Methanofastidiosum sp.]|nr:hypothetical protein [Methanofastidiosum sp.]